MHSDGYLAERPGFTGPKFFQEIYWLQQWKYRPRTSKRNPYVGKLVNKYIYEQLPQASQTNCGGLTREPSEVTGRTSTSGSSPLSRHPMTRPAEDHDLQLAY